MFVSQYDHSHHRQFIAPRRIICIQHLCRTFVSYFSALLRQTSADFNELRTPTVCAINARHSIRALLHHSTRRNISSTRLIFIVNSFPFSLDFRRLQNARTHIVAVFFLCKNKTTPHWFMVKLNCRETINHPPRKELHLYDTIQTAFFGRYF